MSWSSLHEGGKQVCADAAGKVSVAAGNRSVRVRSSALYCLLWLGVIVEGRAGCAYLGNDSTLDAFDAVIEYKRMFAGWMKLLSTHDG